MVTYRFRSRISTIQTMLVARGRRAPRPSEDAAFQTAESAETVALPVPPITGETEAPPTLPADAKESLPPSGDAVRRRGRYAAERQKIFDGGVLEALLEFVDGKREMSSGQVSAAFSVLRKALPDLSPVSLPEDGDNGEGAIRGQEPVFEFRIVDTAAAIAFGDGQLESGRSREPLSARKLAGNPLGGEVT